MVFSNVMRNTSLTTTIYNSMLSFATSEGINASSKEERFGCIFGRDSFITILKLLKVCENPEGANVIDKKPLMEMCRRALTTLITLQGRASNIESGEEPGKLIHEYRKDKYENLINRPRPWYLYPDKVMRNYDSIDSTPLGLIAIYKYWKQTGDSVFLLKALPAVEKGLNWMITYGDRDKDGLLEYELPKERIHGGLVVQSWTDSHESLTQMDGKFPIYPIAPVEVQGYAWLAFKLWADYYADLKTNYLNSQQFSQKLTAHAEKIKSMFNNSFMFSADGFNFPAQALDGHKNQIRTITGNPLLLLWSSYENNGIFESIIDDKFIPELVNRSFLPDMFDDSAGIRTMSTKSPIFNSKNDSYHNGSFWPKLNGMSHEGLVNMGYAEEAEKLRNATLKPIEYFGSPIELYIKTDEGEYIPYVSKYGKESCRQQAWSAAVALDLLTL
ncbi:MAG TPA: amylo-alpha-1,6-glucosidase [Xanthomonadales bacterium]|nr:amylo-alpha-1,6-glucosidase [Xanthomonadales bacterium]